VRTSVLALSVAALAASHAAVAAAAPPADTRTVLVAGVVEAPPYAIKDANGVWSGVSVDLWRGIAKELKVETRIRELPSVGGLIDGILDHSIDVAIGPLAMTSELETVVDFSHAYLTDRLGIAVRPQSERDRWVAVAKPFLSIRFLSGVLGLALLLLLAGAATWWFERKQNAGFDPSAWSGVGSGFWWSVVTLTSVGYGDKVPRTVGGRAVASVWMVASLVLVAVFTATVTSRLAVSHLQDVRGPADLPRARVGAVQDTPTADYLPSHGVNPQLFPSTAASLDALSQGQLDAAAGSLARLRYGATKQDPAQRVTVVPTDVDEQLMAFGVPTGSPLRERINVALLRTLQLPAWQRIRASYFGAAAALD
jgi:ABC-type amino acid transport substrate-binding protein